jgi:hypothetical protein
MPVESLTPYRHLQSEKIIDTVELLARRIHERFPESGLHRVATELHAIAQEAVVRAERIRRPNLWLRAFVALLVAAILGLVYEAVRFARVNEEMMRADNLAQSIEATLGSVVFIGAAIIFLFSLELRMKRARALDAVRELRSLAHIIDMHQLTKDPERMSGRGPATASSPKRSMSPFLLGRYLDYCSELLSLVGKTGALYVQEFPDPTAIEAVDRLTGLSSDLSRNIWQKIMILQATLGAEAEQPQAADAAKNNGEADDEVTAAPPSKQAQID